MEQRTRGGTIMSAQKGLYDPTIQDDFAAFHANHPGVYEELVALARRAKESGQSAYGIASLFEVLRWHRITSGPDHRSGFKLNNNYRSRYARLIARQEPDLADFFRCRKLEAA